MQTLQTSAPKRFTLGHMVWISLVLTVLVGVLSAVTTLSITGDLPGQQSNAMSAPAAAVRATQLAQQQLYGAHTDARQEALELQAAEHGVRASTEQRYLDMERQEFAEFMRRND